MAEDWLVDVRKYASDADEAVVGAIVRYLGIALQSRDASLVAFSDKKETDLVRENYLKKKLGLTHDDADLDAAIASVGERMKEDRTKNRVTVYYLLAEQFGLLHLFGGAVSTAGTVAAAGAAMAAPLGVAAPIPDVFPETAPTPAPEPATAAPAYAMSGDDDDGAAAGGGWHWLKWLLLLALLAALLFFLMRSCSVWQAAPVIDTKVQETAGASKDAEDVATGAKTAEQAATDEAATTEEAAPAVPEGSGVVAGERDGKPMLTVYFDSGKSTVSNDLANAAAKLKDYAAKNPNAKLAISGFNDPTGGAAANAAISKRRAEEVGKALQKAGIAGGSIVMVKPKAATDASGDNANARRVEVTVQ